MIKRLGLSSQITIVFIVAFLITSTLLGVFITRRLDNIYEDNAFEKLEAEGKALSVAEDISNYTSAEGIAYIAYSSKDASYITSPQIENFANKDSIKLLINKVANQKENAKRYKNIINSKEIYYVALKYYNLLGIRKYDVIIVLTGSAMKGDMMRGTAIQILLICFIAFLLGYLIIFLWATKLVEDTKKISNAVDEMGNDRYEMKIATTRQDEIGELADNIELMRERIVESEKDKQEIIQGVSHDLKTPIAIIQSHAEALKDGIYDSKEVAGVTLKQCERLSSKVSRLLNVTRLGYIELNPEKLGETHMQSLISEEVELYKASTEVNIKSDLEEVYFKGDKESWRIVLQNILDNGLRYAKTEIVITLKQNELSIFNDGEHIQEDKLPKIFDAYEKGNHGNFGLGLSIVKRTVVFFGYEIKAINLKDGVSFVINKL